MELNRKDFKEQFSRNFQGYDSEYMMDYAHESVMSGFDELFYHIEAIESENKELKAKLEAIEANKVAEFSGKAYMCNIDCGNGVSLVYPDYKDLGVIQDKRYTITVSKETGGHNGQRL